MAKSLIKEPTQNNKMASNYGDLHQIPTTGCSATTGRQDGQNFSGIIGSEKLAETDLKRMQALKPMIQSVSRRTGIDAALIAGIISRESRAGNALDSKGYGDHGNAFGVMQVDKRWHTPRGGPNSEEHISQATGILCSMFTAIQSKFPQWTTNQHMKGALAAYNMGPDNVNANFDDIDSRTTGKDYSNDVVARAKFYNRHGY